jgi:hypothetical protein
MNIEERREEIHKERAFNKKWDEILYPMTIEELHKLNELVVHRIRMMKRIVTLGNMSKFRVGDKVKFKGHNNEFISGKIIRLNNKTASIDVGDNEGHWRIPPQFLEKAD